MSRKYSGPTSGRDRKWKLVVGYGYYSDHLCARKTHVELITRRVRTYENLSRISRTSDKRQDGRIQKGGRGARLKVLQRMPRIHSWRELKYDDRICYECFMEWQSVIPNSVNGQERGPTIHGRLSRPQDRNADGIVPGRQWVLTLESEALMSLHGPRMFSTVSHSLSILAVRSFSPVKDSGMRIAESTRGSTIAICGRKKDLPRTDPSAQSSRLGFFRAGYTAAGIYAASTAKRVASQKSPCKNEERSKEGDEEEENGERYRLKTVKSRSTLSPVQLAKRLSLFSLVLLVLWTPNPIKGRCARSEKRSAWRIAAESIESREIRDLNFPIQLATLNEMHFYNRVNTRTTVFQPPTVSSSRHQDFIAKLHQVAWVASAGRSVAKSSGGASVAVSFVISRTTRVGESRERAEVGKKEFRHSARRPERTQQWPRINIITVRLG
ncbi:hypothetical protein EAG_16277 [Camponotus floridanus]|uniref:Uncharacterized protein n=1 Tax=Camponotus floridanus TaxID=104421 RepID=E2AGA4_CAMFO|nr:hypothetical protein EAG_16277 [Camponotus floridanus]